MELFEQRDRNIDIFLLILIESLIVLSIRNVEAKLECIKYFT